MIFFAYFFDGIKIYDTHFYKYYFNVPFLKAGIIIESLYVYMQSLFSSSEKFKKMSRWLLDHIDCCDRLLEQLELVDG